MQLIYILEIIVKDCVINNCKFDMISVLFSLMDVNDNVLSFVKSYYFQLVNEDIVIGDEVIIVKVIDFDFEFNGEFVYFIVSGNEWGFFSIEFN